MAKGVIFIFIVIAIIAYIYFKKKKQDKTLKIDRQDITNVFKIDTLNIQKNNGDYFISAELNPKSECSKLSGSVICIDGMGNRQRRKK